jgi:hypothetical protein
LQAYGEAAAEMVSEVWDPWLTFDPVVSVHDRLDNLRKRADERYQMALQWLSQVLASD